MALMFGAISTATAPATTIMIIRQYRSRGKFTDILLGTVAIDDAWGIIIFSLCLAMAQAFQFGHSSELFILIALVKATGKIVLSIILGSIMAFLTSRLSDYLKRKEVMLTFILGAILINTGLALHFSISPLLANMCFGAVIINIERTAFKYFDSVNSVDWPLYVMFYVLAGASLDIGLLTTIGIVGSVYIIFRVIGRIIGGGYAGGLIAGTDDITKKYMGLALMPQAGVAIGLAIQSYRSNLSSFSYLTCICVCLQPVILNSSIVN